MPHELPFTVSVPELAVTFELVIQIPRALIVPFFAVPVIVTLPEPVAEMLEDCLS